MSQKLNKHTEYETKYRVDGDLVYEFIQLVQSITQPYEFIYVQGKDRYYTKSDNSFIRYRKSDNERKGRAEITMKQKPADASSNIKRKEVNWRVDNTPLDTIEEGVKMMGFDFNFEIYKTCHIYKFDDATVVFYTVFDESKNKDHFIEIELHEETIHHLTEQEAKNVIKKYESILMPLGITYRNRLNKSLYEMYVKDIYASSPKEEVKIV